MKTKIIHAKSLLALLISATAFCTSCQKDINEKPGIPTEPVQENIQALQNDDASVAIDWYHLQLRMILNANPALSPLVVNRMFGYTGISLFEAARFEVRNSISLTNQLNEMPAMPKPDENKKYSWIGSANAALATITRNMFPVLSPANLASIDSLEKVYHNKIIASDGANVATRSQAFGDTVATRIFEWSKTDLFNHIADPYTPPVGKGLWVPTPPLYLPAAGPYAGNCRTFLRSHTNTKLLPLPFPYSDKKSSPFYNMANNNYRISKSLTTDQKNIALFWNDAGVGNSYTPMGHNISIITNILINSDANLAKAEEAYVRAGLAMWDATVVCWRAKYKYNVLRPVTYIRANIDTAWLPFIITPPHPEYPAAHAMITSSVMQAMNSVFGYGYHFTDHTYDFLSYPARSYNSFEEAAEECGMSRVYGGIHYLQSVNIAHSYGSYIGEQMASVRLTKLQ